MDFRRRECSDGHAAAPDAVTDEKRSQSQIVSTARVSAVEATSGNDERRAPWQSDLSAVCVSAERQTERAITDGSNAVRRMHQHYARSFRSVHREIAARNTVGGIVEAADGDVREIAGHAHVL